MNLSVLFTVTCPQCQRRRQQPVDYLGAAVLCRQCGATFKAVPLDQISLGQLEPIQYSLRFCSSDVPREPEESSKPK